MIIGAESETIEFKLTTGEKKEAAEAIVAILNKHCKGTLYFGIDDKKIGMQFFGENGSSAVLDKDAFVQKMCALYDLDYGTHDKSIIDSMWNMVNNDQIPNKNVKLILQNFDAIKKISPSFVFAETSGEGAFFNGYLDCVVINSSMLDNGVGGTSATLGHENGHAILHYTKGDKSDE